MYNWVYGVLYFSLQCYIMINITKNEKQNKSYILYYILTCILFFFLIETIHRRDLISIKQLFDFPSIIYLIVFFIFSSSYVFIFERPIILCAVHYSFWCIIAIVSNINLYFKGIPLSFEDLFLFKEAANIASKYVNKTIILNFAIIIICLLLIFAVLFKYFYNVKINLFNIKNKFIKLPICFIFLLFYLFATNNLFKFGESITYNISDFNPIDTYNKNGFLYAFYKSSYSFLNSYENSYDINKVLEIKNRIKHLYKKDPEEKQNFILIQMESLLDPLKLSGVTYSKDPLENFHELCKTNAHGEIIVPVIGGGTTQTEFEILTGINIKNLFTKMPYLNLLNHTPVESISNIFKTSGYETTSLHNYFSTFYNRTKAYENLGFNTFIPLETISSRDMSQNYWYKDYLLIDEIKNTILSTDKKDFIFGVTVESHGPYNTKIDPEITVESNLLDENEKIELQNYVNIIKQVDEFIVNLMNALNETNEDYVLVLYSDHLPALGKAQSTFEKTLNKNDFFKTPYIILKSPNIKEINLGDEPIHAYEFTHKILKELGFNSTVYQNFREEFKNDENFKEYEKQLLLDIKIYNQNIYENGVFPYEKNKIKVGRNSPIINDIVIHDHVLYIIGDNFTPNAKILINKKQIDSEFVSKNYIRILDYLPNNGDIFNLVTYSNKNSPLNVSNSLKYNN